MAKHSADTLNSRITILKKSVQRDSENNLIVSYVDVASVWASVKALKSYDSVTKAGERAVINYEVVIRYNKTLLPEIDAIEYKGRHFILNSPAYNQNNEFIVIYCNEVVGRLQKACAFSELP